MYQCGCWLSPFAIHWFLHHFSSCISEERSLGVWMSSFAPSLVRYFYIYISREKGLWIWAPFFRDHEVIIEGISAGRRRLVC